MRIRDERQVRRAGTGPYGVVIANGPPDNETLDRRRVDPPAGCRAATEPANVPQRRSVDDAAQHTTPVIRPATDGRFRSVAGRAALVAQEALDVRDEVVARREPL